MLWKHLVLPLLALGSCGEASDSFNLNDDEGYRSVAYYVNW